MRIVFMGTPTLAASILEGLMDHHEIVGVYTRPDAIRGRGNKLVSSPVKQVAQAAELPVFTPKSFKDKATVDELASLNPDAICVVAYGALLPKAVLDIPRFGCLNVHGSLLPRWRGAAPLERAILSGDRTTGISIMKMEEGLDTGPYCLQEAIKIDSFSSQELYDQMAEVGTHLLLNALLGLEKGLIEWHEQPEQGVLYATKIEKGELNPKLGDTYQTFSRKVQASSLAHPSKISLAGKTITLEKIVIPSEAESNSIIPALSAGEVTFQAKRLFLGTQNGVVELLQVKPDGKKSMDGRSFAAGIQGIKSNKVSWEEL